MAAPSGSTADLGQRAGNPVRTDRGNRDGRGVGSAKCAAKPPLRGRSVGASHRRLAPRTIPQTIPRGEIPIAHGPGPRLPPLEAFGRRPSARSDPARMGRHPKPFTIADVGVPPQSGRSQVRRIVCDADLGQSCTPDSLLPDEAPGVDVFQGGPRVMMRVSVAPRPPFQATRRPVLARGKRHRPASPRGTPNSRP